MSEYLTFWGHIAELRRALIASFIIISCGIVGAFFSYQYLIPIFTKPLQSEFHTEVIQRERIINTTNKERTYTLPSHTTIVQPLPSGAIQQSHNTFLIPPGGILYLEHTQQKPSLVMLSPLEGMITSFKMSFWIGLIGTSPLWMFFILRFLMPALSPKERTLLFPFLTLSILFLLLGLMFAYFITIPFANSYLQLFNAEIGTNLWTLSHYMDYTLMLLLATAFVFELCLLLLFLVHFGIFTPEALIDKRRHMIVAAFILGAILTPPDVLTQFLLAIPLIGLYELTILYGRIRKRI